MAILGLDSKLKVSLFISYIFLWSMQGILVHLGSHSKLRYNYTVAVFLQDFAKLVLSFGLFHVHGEKHLLQQLRFHWKLFPQYFIPAALYALYNNLTFYGLSAFDPASYFVLMQFKIVVTAFLSIFFLNKSVSKTQWYALLLIMVGSMLKEYKAVLSLVEFSSLMSSSISSETWKYLLILCQLLLSASAGVYTEKLLKNKNYASPNVQNFVMYVDGMLVNMVVFMFSNRSERFEISHLFDWLQNPLFLAIILNAAVTGVVTGFFLKNLGSILKSIASALELWTTAIIAWFVFAYQINSVIFIAICLVSCGVWLYSASPSTEKPKKRSSPTKHSKLSIA
jgi:solute carrier family 35 (UDP-sugar transporter), member A1/2/3